MGGGTTCSAWTSPSLVICLPVYLCIWRFDSSISVNPQASEAPMMSQLKVHLGHLAAQPSLIHVAFQWWTGQDPTPGQSRIVHFVSLSLFLVSLCPTSYGWDCHASATNRCSNRPELCLDPTKKFHPCQPVCICIWFHPGCTLATGCPKAGLSLRQRTCCTPKVQASCAPLAPPPAGPSLLSTL